MRNLSTVGAVILLTLFISACENQASTPAQMTFTAAETQPGDVSTPDSTEYPAAESTADSKMWIEFTLNEVEIGLWLPEGWVTQYDDGFIMAEHHLQMSDPSGTSAGIQVYIFVPPLDGFTPPREGHNAAQVILNQVIEKPELIGQAAVSLPTAFTWSAHHAAYYLLTGSDGTRTMVLAVALPVSGKIVVCNISMPPEYVPRVGVMLPDILGGIRINGVTLDRTTLDAIPTALVFPPVPTGIP